MTHSGKQAWFWIMPNVAVGLFVLAMAALLWILHNHETEQQRHMLRRDMQWAEQTIQLHLQVNQETLLLLANDLALGTLDAASFQIRASQHMANNPELVAIFWVDEHEQIHWSAPFESNVRLPGESLSHQRQPLTALQQARENNKAVYTPLLSSAAGDSYIEIYAPIYAQKKYRGSIGGRYSMKGILSHLIPAWFSDKYFLRLLDAKNQVISTNSHQATDKTGFHDIITLDPPGQGLKLQVGTFKTDSRLAQTMLVALILGLSAVIVWSLVALRRHMIRRAQAEEKLRNTACLITMGEMASSLAHELNQPLSAIANYSKGCVDRLMNDQTNPKELLDVLQKISSQADRAGNIIRHIRDFVSKRENQRHLCKINDIVTDVMSFADIEARAQGIKIVFKTEPDLPPLSIDRIMIEQVILNLVKNGVESMQHTEPHKRELSLNVKKSANTFIEVAIGDRGHGVTPESLDKLFLPFYTTKPNGMGMGLSICRSIIEFHQGRLWIEANPGGGSLFKFILPVELNHDRS